jgi:hypothetical protein
MAAQCFSVGSTTFRVGPHSKAPRSISATSILRPPIRLARWRSIGSKFDVISLSYLPSSDDTVQVHTVRGVGYMLAKTKDV